VCHDDAPTTSRACATRASVRSGELPDTVLSVTLAPETLLVVALVVLAGYTIFGATGFGASPITIPVLAHVLPLPFVLALAAILDVASGVALGFHTRREAATRELLVLVPFTLIGLTLGVTLLVRLPRDATLLALGAFVCLYALYVMLRRGTPRRLSRRWAAPAGLLGGIVGALFGMGGPPYVVYLTGRIVEPAAQRATISQMVILNVGLRVVAFALAGLLFSRALWLAALLLLPVAWAGLWAGHRAHVTLSPALMARVIAGALLLSGVSLIVRTL
jgi:uncharacterized membrane protein YfcA